MNKDKIREYHKKYRETHKDKIREYHKKYRETHKDKIKEYQKKYWAKNGEEINAKRRNRKAYKFKCKKAIEYLEPLKDGEIGPYEINEILKILKGDEENVK